MSKWLTFTTSTYFFKSDPFSWVTYGISNSLLSHYKRKWAYNSIRLDSSISLLPKNWPFCLLCVHFHAYFSNTHFYILRAMLDVHFSQLWYECSSDYLIATISVVFVSMHLIALSVIMLITNYQRNMIDQYRFPQWWWWHKAEGHPIWIRTVGLTITIITLFVTRIHFTFQFSISWFALSFC